jgi:hypothetical protein
MDVEGVGEVGLVLSPPQAARVNSSVIVNICFGFIFISFLEIEGFLRHRTAVKLNSYLKLDVSRLDGYWDKDGPAKREKRKEKRENRRC